MVLPLRKGCFQNGCISSPTCARSEVFFMFYVSNYDPIKVKGSQLAARPAAVISSWRTVKQWHSHYTLNVFAGANVAVLWIQSKCQSKDVWGVLEALYSLTGVFSYFGSLDLDSGWTEPGIM